MATESIRQDVFEFDFDDFLAHYGVKGMRWGVRRSVDPSTGLVRKRDFGTKGVFIDRNGHEAQGVVNKRTGDIHALDANGNPTSLILKKAGDYTVRPDGHPSDSHSKVPDVPGHQSADHERASKAFAKAQEKGPQSLSNDELKAIEKRVEAEKKFKQLTEGQKSEMQKAVDQMMLEKQYNQLMSEKAKASRSTGRKIIDSLVSSAADTAKAQAAEYGQSMVKDMLGLNQGPSKLDVMKKQVDAMRVQKDHMELTKQLKAGGVLPMGMNPKVGSGPIRVNPSKIKISPTKIP